MKKDLISIALCTYNGEKYLRQQLQSIIMQTHKNLEIIIVDDCSTDQTLNIIIEFAYSDSRIRWYKNEVNMGVNQNFQRAFALCTGSMIAISDQDDIWEPQKIERLADTLAEHWLVFSNSTLIDAGGQPVGQNLLNYFKYQKGDYRSITLLNFVTGHTCLMKAEFLKEFLPVPEDVMYDWWMGFVALYHDQLVYLDETLTRYRIHVESVIQQFFNPAINKPEDIDKFYYKAHMDHLNGFSRYQQLKPEQSAFITELYDGFRTKGNDEDQTAFINMLDEYYSVLFPQQEPRADPERLEYVRKYASRLPAVFDQKKSQ